MASRQEIVFRRRMSASAERAFAWHMRPGAFERLTPPWEKAKVLTRHPRIEEGSRVMIQTSAGRWLAEHRHVEPPQRFDDVQITGPFKSWHHEHHFESAGADFWMEDRIRYELPAGVFGSLVAGSYVRGELERLFRYRHEVLAIELARPEVKPLKILVSGASGLVGHALCSSLSTAGHQVVRLVRRHAQDEEASIQWNPETQELDAATIEHFDAVIHLSGETVAQRWSAETKKRIRDSRIASTTFLSRVLSKLQHRPQVFLCASAIGFYGERGEDVLTESSEPGAGFLPETAQAWEAACRPAAEAGIRVAHLRFGVILSPAGGALKKMLLPYKAGLGGPLGDGQAWMSWVSIEDVVGAVHHALQNSAIQGPVNVTAPEPVRNEIFSRTLAAVLHRPAVARVPRMALAAIYGADMVDATLLASTRAIPNKLIDTGYRFLFPTLNPALRHVLGK
jgi:uncharacterized protein